MVHAGSLTPGSEGVRDRRPSYGAHASWWGCRGGRTGWLLEVPAAIRAAAFQGKRLP